MDRINNLPDEIICHILSFLRIKEAGLSSLLSKRWRNLYAFTPTLRFDDLEVRSGQSFIDSMDRLLAVSSNFPMRKNISIKCRWSCNLSRATRWMVDMMIRGASNLDIVIIACEINAEEIVKDLQRIPRSSNSNYIYLKLCEEPKCVKERLS